MSRIEEGDLAYMPDGIYVKTMTCKTCRETVYDVDTVNSDGDLAGACKAIALHMEIRHDVIVDFRLCSDPDCTNLRHIKT